MELFIVNAYRNGNREKHSYTVADKCSLNHKAANSVQGAVRRSSRPKITDRKPDETGIYIDDKSLEVNVWVNYAGRCHGSDDYFEVFIQTTDGKFVTRFTEIYSQIPSFVVNGKGYYKGK